MSYKQFTVQSNLQYPLITAKEVRDEFIRSRKTTDINMLDRLDNERKAYEAKLALSVVNPAEKKMVDALYKSDPKTINAAAVNNLLKNDFYMVQTEEGLHLLSAKLLKGSNLLETSKKVHQHVKNFKSLAAGAYGNVWLTSIAGTDNQDFRVIVKTSKDKNADDLRHEVIIGLLALNNLRSRIPNFSYIYGSFECSPPTTNANNQVLDFCTVDGSNVITYALQENIPGDTISKAITRKENPIDGGRFLNYYLQALFALNISHREYRTSHYDMHSGNLILRDVSFGEGFQMEYETSNNKYYLTSDKVATIIDYGMMGFQYKNRYLGVYNLSEFRGSRDFPHFDSFKLLMFCLLDARDSNNQSVLDIGARILKFYTNEDINTMIDLHAVEPSTFFELPNFPDLIDLTLEPLIDFILDPTQSGIDCSEIVSNSPRNGYRVLQCEEMCLSPTAVKEAITTPPSKTRTLSALKLRT